MHIEIVESRDEFDALEARWTEVYLGDAQAHLFTSWSWLRICREMTPYGRWFVLTGRNRSGGEIVGFLPLAIVETDWHRYGKIRHLHMGGKPISDYTGMVCVPGAEHSFLTACATYLQHRLTWDCLHLHDLMDSRITDFIEAFGGKSARRVAYRRVDCPYITLEGDWDAYLKNSLSKEPRRTLRKKLRRFQTLAGIRLTEPNTTDIEVQVEALLRLWQARHGKSDGSLMRNRHLLKAAFARNHLWLRVAWMADRPVCGLAAFVDPLKRAFYCFMTAFDPAFEKHSPGLVLYGLAIRDAIERGYRHFDLLRGAPDYKLTRLGAMLRQAESVDLQYRAIWWRGLTSVYRQRDKALKAVGS
jgi:CelD/BcsL family acetyltransferase involved in cellulose biosynthesis